MAIKQSELPGSIISPISGKTLVLDTTTNGGRYMDVYTDYDGDREYFDGPIARYRHGSETVYIKYDLEGERVYDDYIDEEE